VQQSGPHELRLGLHGFRLRHALELADHVQRLRHVGRRRRRVCGTAQPGHWCMALKESDPGVQSVLQEALAAPAEQAH